MSDGLGNLRGNPAYQACIAELDRLRIPHTVEFGGRHPKIVFDFRGKEYRRPIAGTPGDTVHGPRNAVADIRRFLREAGREENEKNNMMNVPLPVIVAVPFHGQEIQTFERDGLPFVVLKSVADGMGLDWGAQYHRLRRDPVLSTCMSLTNMQIGGQRREVVALPLEFLMGFLFGVDARRVKPVIRDRVVDFQRECYRALTDYWIGGVAQNQKKQLGGELSPDVVGGIVKKVVRRALDEERSSMHNIVVQAIAPIMARIDAMTKPVSRETGDLLTAYEVIMGPCEVPKQKFYGGLPGQISAKLALFCASNAFQIGVVETRPGKKFVFPRAAVIRWLEEGGRADVWRLVTAHSARHGGQTVMAFPRSA